MAKSSSRKSSSNSRKSSIKVVPTSPSGGVVIFNTILSLVINSAIIYFTFQLERPECQYDCKLDWRHNFVKYTAMLCIANTIIMLGNFDNMAVKVLFNITSWVSLINLFVLFSYMYQITNSKCGCANVDNPQLTTVLLYYSYFKMFLALMIILILILGISQLVYNNIFN